VVNDDASDGHPSFHGCASLAPLPGGDWFAVWVDSREHRSEGAGEARASLFSAVSSDGGQSWSDNRPLTDRACACCRVTALPGADGAIAVAYRSMWGGARDPALLVTRNRGTSVALDTVLAADGWRTNSCPMDGPAATADHDGGGHYAWYSAANGGAVWNVPWRTTGIAGLKRVLSDSLASGGHPRMIPFGDATLLAIESGVERDTVPGAIAVRALASDGSLTPWLFFGADARGADLTAIGDRAALVGWTERVEQGERIRLARLIRR